MTKLTSKQSEILVGILLGDASFQTENQGKTYRLRISQSDKHKQYVFHLYEIFKNFTSSPPVRYEFTDKRSPEKKFVRWSFSTLQSASLRFYGHQFYDGHKKKVPNLIHRWLTPRALAYWYMDDGAQKWKGKSLGVRFCTDNFILAEVQHLAKILTEQYSLKVSIQKKGDFHRLYISSYSYDLLKKLIFLFLIETMKYKFPEKQEKI